MKHNTVLLLARLALASCSPAKRSKPRQLRVTLWQTHLWRKEIILSEKNFEDAIPGALINSKLGPA